MGERDREMGGDREDSLSAYIDNPALTEGQRRRLTAFRAVEQSICTRVEELCERSEVDVQDVAILLIAPEAHSLFFDQDIEPGTSVVLSHRSKLHGFLSSVLPPAEDAEVDPYVDLLEPAPPRCVRVLIIDHESLTVLSYGTFVTIKISGSGIAQA